ncbi:MAG: insulinase family protein [Armatimonadetes bacterium]|nr:insulinase family protein [Armatimonadota bacterium]
MLSVFISLAAALQQPHYREADQLKTLLANGSVVYCEKRDAPYVSVQLILNNRDTLDQPSTYGYRHLIEHIAARAVKGQDFEVETAGGYILASTSRDWMRFEWRVPPEKLSLAFKGMEGILNDCGATEAAIKRETVAISHELDLLTSSEKESITAWKDVYGAAGIDPLGSKDSVVTAKPEDLQAIWHKMTRASNVVISACGPLDKYTFTTSAKEVLSGLYSSTQSPLPSRPIDGSYGDGNVVAVPIQPITSKAGANSLVAAFGLAGRLNRPYLIYTPSERYGLAIVGSYDPYESIKTVADGEDPAIIFILGRLNALAWLDSKLSTPEGTAELNGTLLSISPSLRPSKIAENIVYASFDDFKQTWNLIKGVAK